MSDKESKDEETRKELTAVAYRKIGLAVREMEEEGVVKDKETWSCSPSYIIRKYLI